MKMLVVVDYQYDFVSGSLGFAGAELLDKPIAEKIREYMNKGSYIVKTMDTHQKNYLETREGKNLPIEHCIYGTEGWEVYGETKKTLEEADKKFGVHSINKATFGVGVGSMSYLKDMLAMNCIRTKDIETIEFVGLVSNICVISNVCVFQAAFPDAQIVVDPKLIASNDPEMHKAVLKVMQGLQVKFIND